MKKQIGGHEMRMLAESIQKQAPGLGFALIVFEFEKPGICNYISNAQRTDMIKAMEETLYRFKNKEDFSTPETN